MFLRKTPPNDGHDTTSLKETLNESAEGGGTRNETTSS